MEVPGPAERRDGRAIDVPGWLRPFARLYRRLEAAWARLSAGRAIGFALVVAFIGALLAIELGRRGFLPAGVVALLGTSHFGAVAIAFWLLLLTEVLALVFALSHSIANAVGKQFELFSLILLREAFLEFGQFGEPVEWASVEPAVPTMLAAMAGGLLVFVVVGYFYRIQRHMPITADEREQAAFIAAKQAVGLLILVAFLIVAVADVTSFFSTGAGIGFFEVCFTILIFSDVLLVLIALAYTSGYHVVFRNSGFAAATVMLRLALTAPPVLSALLGLGAALFAVALSAAYNHFAPALRSVPSPIA